MKAVVYTKYGGPGVLQLIETDKPAPKNDEVLIKVHAVSLNDWDLGLLRGDFINRMMYGMVAPRKKILGSDIAGTVEAVGKDVKHFKTGDEVYGDLSGRWGGLAEYVCAPEKSIALKSEKMSFIDAAAIPQAAMLAIQGLVDVGKIRSGQKLLINGAGGGVGTFALQIARLYDVEITGVDSAEKLDMMRAIGFDHVIDYRKEDFTRNGNQYDLILDTKTNRWAFDYARVLSSNGVYATVGGSLRKLLQALFLAPWIRRSGNKQIRVVVLKPNKDLFFVNEIYDAGKFKPVIEGPYNLNQVQDAFQLLANGQHKGKVVIKTE